MAQSVLDRIYAEKIIAIVRGISSAQIVDLARALAEGGVSCIEVTFDQTNLEETLPPSGPSSRSWEMLSAWGRAP